MRDAASVEARPVVLVVEDELFIRMQAVSMIEEAGYDVVEASNADDAIAILEVRGDIRIVFTDIEMPGSMDGLKLARYVRDRWPPIQLVVTSGRQQINDADLPRRSQFVPKPYDSHRLVTVIQRLAS
jgi:CheY-like chemotaxis protein